jgi:hypothetical protein
MKDKNKMPLSRERLRGKSKSIQSNCNAASSQRQSLLRWFRNVNSRISTLQARELLGIMSPASRVIEMRRSGHHIILEKEYQIDTAGVRHKVGVYVYMGLSGEVSNDLPN